MAKSLLPDNITCKGIKPGIRVWISEAGEAVFSLTILTLSENIVSLFFYLSLSFSIFLIVIHIYIKQKMYHF